MKRSSPAKILVTGGAGFIGSEFVRLAVARGYAPLVLDKLTYAGDLARLQSVKNKIIFHKTDITRPKQLEFILKKEKPHTVVHFAAESHVDRSILDDGEFVKTNIFGTQNLLKICRHQGIKRFIHISTDEVYGEIPKGRFREDSPLSPNSPYSASKAAADLLVRAYIRTFKFPAIIVRPSNNYGPWQYPEKFIPVILYKALRNEKIPIYAKGLNVREWLHVSDCVRAILAILEQGRDGEIYNVGSGQECRNIDLVQSILKILGRPKSLMQFVADRPGHDIRYALDTTKIRRQIGWRAEVKLDEGLASTVRWYQKHFPWLETKAEFLKAYWEKVYRAN